MRISKKTIAPPNIIHHFKLAHATVLTPLGSSYTEKFSKEASKFDVKLPNLYNVGAQTNDDDIASRLNSDVKRDKDEGCVRICRNCGCLRIPGWNTSIKVIYEKTTQRKRNQKSINSDNINSNIPGKTENIVPSSEWKARHRSLVYSCLDCGYSDKFQILNPSKAKVPGGKRDNEANAATVIGITANVKSNNRAIVAEEDNTKNKTKTAKQRSKKRKKMSSLQSLIQEKKAKEEQDKFKDSLSLSSFMRK